MNKIIEARKRNIPLENKFIGEIQQWINSLPACPHGRQRDQDPEIPERVRIGGPHFLNKWLESLRFSLKDTGATHLHPPHCGTAISPAPKINTEQGDIY
jgi:hypothetical protein